VWLVIHVNAADVYQLIQLYRMVDEGEPLQCSSHFAPVSFAYTKKHAVVRFVKGPR
jgi:hypothetical protein